MNFLSALRRIEGFSRNAREGYLKPNTGWLSTEDGYYMISTICRLVAPLAVFKVMQRKLTAFDVNLDPRIKIQYLLVKALYRSFSGPNRDKLVKLVADDIAPSFKNYN